MTQEGQLPPPPMLWAQRRNLVYLTICLEDCKDKELKIEPQMIYFKGVGGTDQKMHEITINLFDEITPDETVQKHGGRTITLLLFKKTKGPYWPRLTKEKAKAHWLKSDFNKWKDEEDSDDDVQDSPDLEEMVKQMGRVGNFKNNKPKFDDLNDWKDDDVSEDDDEDLPWLFD